MDRSIRIFDHRGSPLCREWGHSEGITGLAHLDCSTTPVETDGHGPSKRTTTLVTTGADGTIMIWDLSHGPTQSNGVDGSRAENGIMKEMTATKRPLRKALSRSELAHFQKVATGSPSSITDGRQSRDSPRTMRKKVSKLANITTMDGVAFSTARKSTDNNDDSSVSPTSTTTPQAMVPSSQRTTAASQLNTESLPFRTSAVSRRRYRTNSTGNIQSLNSHSNPHSRSSPASRRESMASLAGSAEDLCHALRNYRERLSSVSEKLDADSSRELQLELELTLHLVQRRSAIAKPDPGKPGSNGVGDESGRNASGLARAADSFPAFNEAATMIDADKTIDGSSFKLLSDKEKAITEDPIVKKLLTEYSERLLGLVDERIGGTTSSLSTNDSSVRKHDGNVASSVGDGAPDSIAIAEQDE